MFSLSLKRFVFVLCGCGWLCGCHFFGCVLGFVWWLVCVSGAFRSGLRGLFSLVCMALCCFLRVVSVSACCVCFGFSLVDGFGCVFRQ